jgi:uncharacterized membrane protein
MKIKLNHPQDRRAERADTRRAEAFSDSVLAIIITLLVLDLRAPDVPPGQMHSALLQQWPTYVAYVTSYLYVGVVWTNHKAAFRRIRFVDRGLHWANLGILFTTALLPFPTAVIAKAMQHGNLADERMAVGLYAMIGSLLCASWLAFFHYLGRHPYLVKEDVHERFFPAEQTRALAGYDSLCSRRPAGAVASPDHCPGDLLHLTDLLRRHQRGAL